jgi:hypothetical protein
MLTKDQLVERIIALNPSARTDWLLRFDAPALARYLEHLNFAQTPRGTAAWERDGETPPIVTRKPKAA